MPTFKAVVQPHQERRDGKYPVSIRVTHNRRSFYINTGLYVGKNQIQKRSFLIKDNFVLVRTNKTIEDYERTLLTIDIETLRQMSASALKELLCQNHKGIDFFAFCDEIVERDGAIRRRSLRSARLAIEEMGIHSMTANDFTANFLFRYKAHLDSKGLKNKTKNNYIGALHYAFTQMLKTYNTEFHKTITHNPFDNFEYYKNERTARRAMSAEALREFFAITPNTKTREVAKDIVFLSFCLCGMNIMDIVSLKKENWDKKEMRINYNRRKTQERRSDHAFSSIRIEPEVYNVFYKWLAPASSPYLFQFGNIIPNYNASKNVTMVLADICRINNIDRVTPYWFRHTWATIARNDCDVSKDDIDLCLNHVGINPMADVYIKPDWSRIDNANRKVLDFVFSIPENH